MPPICKFKFKFKKTLISKEKLPDGYRMATVDEVGNNFDSVRRLKLPVFNEEDYGYTLLLDGRIFTDSRVEHDIPYGKCKWRLLVKEKEWDEAAQIWKKKASACYSSDGVLWRKYVYDGITLPEEGRHTALVLAVCYHQAEVIYWLLKSTNATEYGSRGDIIASDSYYVRIVRSMWASKLPPQFPLQFMPLDENAREALTNGILQLEEYHSTQMGIEESIVIVELFIELYSIDIVHTKTYTYFQAVGGGMSFMDMATRNGWIPVLTKLLSVSRHSLQDQMSNIKPRFEGVLIEAVERGYPLLLDDLLDLNESVEEITTEVCVEVLGGAVRKGYLESTQKLLEVLQKKAGNAELQQDKHGKTVFHYAAETGNSQVFQLLAKTYQDEYRVKKMDKCGRNFLHWAALNGDADLCKDCIDGWNLKADAKDGWGQNSLHFSAKGYNGHKAVVDILITSSSLELIYSRDDKGRTPLHVAAAKGKLEMVNKLLSLIADDPSRVKKYIQQTDSYSRTALQMAAAGGHTRIVQLFLDNDCDPLQVRDIHGSTTLHYATRAKDANIAIAISQRLLNKCGNSSDEKSLLLWAAAAGIGTAEETEKVDPDVKEFLLREKETNKEHLLRVAATNNNEGMTWELLNRGANIAHIYDSKWRDKLETLEQKENVKTVLNQIKIAKEQGRDKPSHEDNLGRDFFAQGLAALFLNRFIESPITVGISGEWGMGKSSLMIQTEYILLVAASQLAFPNLLRFENFGGAENILLNTKGLKIYQNIKNGVHNYLAQGKDDTGLAGLFSGLVGYIRKIYQNIKNRGNDTSASIPLVELLNKYDPQYHVIYKSLACTDLPYQTVSSNVETSVLESKYQPLRTAPRILTIRYNAWHYRDEHEAWAGLAVTITKEIEQAMTRAQKFSSSWKYSWSKNSVNIWLQIFLPCLLVIFLAGWVAWAAWTLLKEAKFKNLQYGSIPSTIIGIVWVVLNSVISVVKPVSTQMMGYIIKPDHTSRLGYQQEVISDINFLKGELGKKPHWFFPFICGEWCWNWFGLYPDNIENTCVPKFSSASEDQLRIITFVDDLDRCDDKVILQVLSAINLVLVECKINVILGMDKKMIERAVKRNFEDNDDKDLADKFICKIIHIPLSLPDPTDEESNRFLQHQLRHKPPVTNGRTLEDGEDTDYGELDTDNEDEENVADQIPRRESSRVDINSSNGRTSSDPGTMKKLFHWLGHLSQILCLLACNLSTELREVRHEANDGEIPSLTFSKGARLTREMLLSNYTPEEAETLYKLKRFATGNQKLPREWKLLLDYRILASNILSMMGKVYNLPGWTVELVAWIFICWQWKHEMNILIKGWRKYAVLGKSAENEDETGEHWHGPSLKQIVVNYFIELEKSHEITAEKIQTEYLNWVNLLRALDEQDVSMRGIQLFQQFRLHCETDHLPWPFLDTDFISYLAQYIKIQASSG